MLLVRDIKQLTLLHIWFPWVKLYRDEDKVKHHALNGNVASSQRYHYYSWISFSFISVHHHVIRHQLMAQNFHLRFSLFIFIFELMLPSVCALLTSFAAFTSARLHHAPQAATKASQWLGGTFVQTDFLYMSASMQGSGSDQAIRYWITFLSCKDKVSFTQHLWSV